MGKKKTALEIMDVAIQAKAKARLGELLMTVESHGGAPVLRCESLAALMAGTAVACRALSQQDCSPEVREAARALFVALTGEQPRAMGEMEVFRPPSS